MERTAETWTNYAEALAFVGNSLLAPMSQTGSVGLDPAFWEAFPDFGDERVRATLDACARYASESGAGEDLASAVQRASVEYTRLFVGPPHPAAAPWETMYRPGSEGATVGFGQATYEMRALLREAGLEVSNENNQYADHIGIELLFASTLCARVAEAVQVGNGAMRAETEAQLAAFLDSHPRAWVGKLHDAVAHVEPSGYIARLLALAQSLLESL